MTNRNRFRRDGPRRPVVWARQIINVTVAAGVTIRQDLLADLETELGAVLQGVTVTRIIGHLDVLAADVNAGMASVNMVCAIGVMPSAFLWVPSVSEYVAGIMYYDVYTSQSLAQETSAGVFSLQQNRMFDADLHSQRKMRRVEQQLMLAMTNQTGEDNNVRGFLNVLLKLP